MRYSNVIIILFLFSLNTYSQEINLSEIIISIAEDLAADETDPEAISGFIEQLHELSENPVRINSDDEAEISKLFFLSDFQIKAIRDHVRSTGNIVSIYEIASIPGFDRQITDMLIPFITLEPQLNFFPDKVTLRNTLLTNLIIKPGESDTSYNGSSCKALTKYKVASGPFTAGFTAEKDAGERFLSGTPPVPDFLSAYIECTGRGIIRKLIAGDFSARFGQGTAINTGIRTGLSLTAPGYMSGRDQIKPYTSTDENNFFRGVAAEFALKKTGLSLLFSHNNIDATTVSGTDSTAFFVNNFYKTGLHNTSSLLLRKDAVVETSYGMNLTCNLSFIRLGCNWSESRFPIPVNPDRKNPEDLYDFEGKTKGLLSVYYNSLINKILLFGEFSSDYASHFAMVQGVTLRPSDRLTVNFLYRNYSPGFFSFHGRGPGGSSSTTNEEGILGNFTFETAKHLFLSAGCNLSKFPWLKYRTSFPSLARKEEIKLKYLPSDNLGFELSYNYRFSMTDSQEEQGIASVKELTTRAFKVLARYSINENLTLATRIDLKSVEESGSKGMLMLQDITYRLRKVPASIWLRYCIFKTDDWDSRLYIYENDLLYSFSIPALSGEGIRSYVMAKWDIGNVAELRVKYGLTSPIPSENSPEERDEFRMQFRVWF